MSLLIKKKTEKSEIDVVCEWRKICRLQPVEMINSDRNGIDNKYSLNFFHHHSFIHLAGQPFHCAFCVRRNTNCFYGTKFCLSFRFFRFLLSFSIAAWPAIRIVLLSSPSPSQDWFCEKKKSISKIVRWTHLCLYGSKEKKNDENLMKMRDRSEAHAKLILWSAERFFIIVKSLNCLVWS